MQLNELRHDIDNIDRQLTELLEARMSCVLQIAEIKKAQNTPILDTSREQELLAKIAAQVKNPDFQDSIVATYQDILKNSRAYQQKFLGK